jgi:HAE1 family hydrophobic/amphiphilic exporter-1
MKALYRSPFRIYLVLGALALFGILAGTQLPISLYPNSTKPTIWVNAGYGGANASDFLASYGSQVEAQLQAISTPDLKVEKVKANYQKTRVSYEVEFGWGAGPKTALREVQNVMNALSGTWNKEARDSLSVNFWSNNSGFIAISFYSEERTLDDLHHLLEPLIVPKLSAVNDAEEPVLWNPSKKEIQIELDPGAMAVTGLFPSDIERSLRMSLAGSTAGSVTMGPRKLLVEMPRLIESAEDVGDVLIQTPKGATVHLSEVARVEVAESTQGNTIFKTSGARSLMLFASPKSGANVKRMAEEILSIVETASKDFPPDVSYRVLVDPSEFIRSSVKNVLHEVFLAAGLAVLVLYLFIGSFKNTVTAAIEIPLSMILAFVLMRATGMNLNLISLGGLALSAGMNVDASVVVMENIFRHFENAKGKLSSAQRLSIVMRAVKEVWAPILCSTVTSLVVFAPLAFTSALTNAILGDLAKAVVFSHGLSAFVALVLVPTVRLHLMGREIEKTGVMQTPHSPIEKQLTGMESGYDKLLGQFINSRYVKWVTLGISAGLVLVVVAFVMPNLKREIIGTPDTDWMVLSINTSGNTKVAQMENDAAEIEDRLMIKFGSDISYTFTQVNAPNRAVVMARLHNKSEMGRVWKAMEAEFQNTPTLFFWVGPWNPAELPIPDPPQMRMVIRGGEASDRAMLADALMGKLQEEQSFDRVWSEPSVSREEGILLTPDIARWTELSRIGVRFTPFDLADLVRVATDGRSLGNIDLENKSYPVSISFPSGEVSSREDIEAFPLGVDGKLIPLGALAQVNLEVVKPAIYREDGRELVIVKGKNNKGEEARKGASLAKSREIVEKEIDGLVSEMKLASKPLVSFEDSEKELTDALSQLGVAVGISILLVFFTLLLQFGNLAHALIVMSAIPFGVLGVGICLFAFDSTLSLNSVLGIILLNGISVANSIILVDFTLRLVDEGVVAAEAAKLAARARLRPILITSLTTILGMLPIAMGSGEGGKILQPLGIAVSGGLWVSMVFTLFIVPFLEAWYLGKQPPKPRTLASEIEEERAVLDVESGSALWPQ